MKPNTFHEAFGNTGIDPEMLTWVTPKTAQNMIIDKSMTQQQLKVHFQLDKITIAKVSKEVEYNNAPWMTEG